MAQNIYNINDTYNIENMIEDIKNNNMEITEIKGYDGIKGLSTYLNDMEKGKEGEKGEKNKLIYCYKKLERVLMQNITNDQISDEELEQMYKSVGLGDIKRNHHRLNMIADTIAANVTYAMAEILYVASGKKYDIREEELKTLGIRKDITFEEAKQKAMEIGRNGAEIIYDILVKSEEQVPKSSRYGHVRVNMPLLEPL